MESPKLPTFVYDDDDINGQTRQSLEQLESGLRESPQLYLEAIDVISDKTIVSANPAIAPAVGLLKSVLSKGLDKKIDFDDETEAVIQTDERHLALLALHKAARNVPIHRSGHVAGSHPGYDTEDNSKAVRLDRFRCFAERILLLADAS